MSASHVVDSKPSVEDELSEAETNYTTDTVESDQSTDVSIRKSRKDIARTGVASQSIGPIMIFDWDDTLLPTSFLKRNNLRLDGPSASPAIQKILDDYTECVRLTLAEAARHGSVIIVTNAETGWVDLTARKFMPLLVDEIAKIPQLSARSAYEPMGVKDPFEWKERAFGALVEDYYRGHSLTTERHVISFGDSSHEREAALRVCAAMADRKLTVRCKSLKFMERPDIDHMRKEHSLIKDCMGQIVAHAGPLDLCIQCQASNDQASAPQPQRGVTPPPSVYTPPVPDYPQYSAATGAF